MRYYMGEESRIDDCWGSIVLVEYSSILGIDRRSKKVIKKTGIKIPQIPISITVIFGGAPGSGTNYPSFIAYWR